MPGQRSSIGRINVPLLLPEDIKSHLGAPHHWKDGRSAKLLIEQWWTANAIPPSLLNLLNQAAEWQDPDLVDAFAERRTSLNDGRPSHPQSDVLAIVGIQDRLGVVSIEAKVDEGFDKTIDEWRTSDSTGKQRRLAGLCELLCLNPSSVGSLRYQLLHRVASAVIEARRYRAHQAAMVVQSWCPARSSHDDFAAFLTAMEMRYDGVGMITDAKVVAGIAVRMGWLAEAG